MVERKPEKSWIFISGGVFLMLAGLIGILLLWRASWSVRKERPLKKITYDSVEDVKFFEPNGKPRVWYYRNSAGDYELFTAPGVHPILGVELKPITEETVLKIKEHLLAKKKQKKRRLEEEKEKRFRDRYIAKRGLRNSPDRVEIALVSNDREIKQRVGEEIRGLPTEKPIRVEGAFFKENFINDGLFDALIAGKAEKVRRLQLARQLDYLVLCKCSLRIRDNPRMDGLKTAKGAIEIRLVSTKDLKTKRSFKAAGSGAGFSEAEAKNLWADRVLRGFDEKIKDWIK